MPAKRKLRQAPAGKAAIKGNNASAKAAAPKKRSVRQLRQNSATTNAPKRTKVEKPAKTKKVQQRATSSNESERESKQEYVREEELDEDEFDFDDDSDSGSDSGSESETDGINLTKRDQDADLEEEDDDDDDEEEEKGGEDADELNVTFEFNVMDEKYYHGMNSLVETVFPPEMGPEVTEAILAHVAVGTLVSCENSTDVFAFGTAMPLEDGPVRKFVRRVLSSVSDFEVDFEKHALLMTARFVNLPPPLISLLFDNVVKDIDWAKSQKPPKFTKNKFIYIAPCKLEGGAPKAGEVALNSLQFDRFEDELICQESERWVFIENCFRRSMSTDFPSIVIAELTKQQLDSATQQISDMCAV